MRGVKEHEGCNEKSDRYLSIPEGETREHGGEETVKEKMVKYFLQTRKDMKSPNGC